MGSFVYWGLGMFWELRDDINVCLVFVICIF